MTNRADQIGTREWLEENNRRVIFQQHMYNCAGRQNPDHPMHGLFTGLWHDFCLNEAGKAQRDGWFDRMDSGQPQRTLGIRRRKIIIPREISSIN